MKRLLPTAAFTLVTLAASVAIAQQTGSFANPLTVDSVPDFISKALKVMVMVALPIISLFIVYSGFMFVIARGNESMLSEAKKNFFYVIIGAILILGAWVIATLIGGTISQLVK